jgi:GR25 family glycosyltransferase involved in LPS biosynthesis
MPTGMPENADAFDCRVISLKRTPERFARFLRENESTGLDFKLFEAYDGKNISRGDAIRQNIIAEGVVNYTDGGIGAALSHLSLWKECKSAGRCSLIFEDDAVIRRDFKSTFSRLLPP